MYRRLFSYGISARLPPITNSPSMRKLMSAASSSGMYSKASVPLPLPLPPHTSLRRPLLDLERGNNIFRCLTFLRRLTAWIAQVSEHCEHHCGKPLPTACEANVEGNRKRTTDICGWDQNSITIGAEGGPEFPDLRQQSHPLCCSARRRSTLS